MFSGAMGLIPVSDSDISLFHACVMLVNSSFTRICVFHYTVHVTIIFWPDS